MNEVETQLRRVKKSSAGLIALDEETRAAVLCSLAELLRHSIPEILLENSKDLSALNPHDPKYDRLVLSESLILSIAADLEQVSSLPQSLGLVLEQKNMPNGLLIKKISVPLGVIAVIYESRPNVTIDVFALCFKTGNACVLKGGKEANCSNRCLVELIHRALHLNGVSTDVVSMLSSAREATIALLEASELVDVCIPRGSQELIHFVRSHAKIPVIETGAGIVHTYFDLSGDLSKGRLIINNAKTRRVSVCNALDTLVIHEQRLSDLCYLVELLASKRVIIFADEQSRDALLGCYPEELLHKAKPSDYGTEFLDYKMSIKTVHSIEEAIQHVALYSSGHSEAIIAEDKQSVELFLNQVDAAAVYVNASTAFTDGGQFGMGAEIGISTQKLHARGPMGLAALTSYKWIIYGNGQIRE